MRIPNSTRALCLVVVTTVSTVAAAQPPATEPLARSRHCLVQAAEPSQRGDQILSDAAAQRLGGCASSNAGRRSGDTGLGVMAVLMGLLLVLGARTRRMAG